MALTILAFTLSAGAARASVPDAYGYVLKTSAQGGCAFSFTDLSADPNSAKLDLSTNGEANVTMPFQFTFYGLRSDRLRIGNNGGVLFGVTTGEVSPFNTALPNGTAGRSMFPLWDAMDGNDPADLADAVYVRTLGTAPTRRFVVQWHHLRRLDPDPPSAPPSSTATFQLVLFERTNNIQFQYLDVDYGDARFDYGQSATIGLNEDGANALQVSSDAASLSDGSAVCFASPVSEEDAFGYHYVTSSSGSCASAFTDISSTGTRLNLTASEDDGETNVTLPFDFTFYGVRSNAMRVGNNGAVRFDEDALNISFDNTQLPNAAYPLSILPLWGDLDDDAGNSASGVYTEYADGQFIVQWNQRPYVNGLGSGTFQLVLDQATQSLRFQYQDVEFAASGFDPERCPDGVDGGACATIGINQDATNALQYSFKTASLSPDLAICFFPPTTDLSVTKDDGHTQLVSGSPVTYTITVTNHGPRPAVGAVVKDDVPPSIGSVGWTCTASPGSSCTAAGSGDVDDTVNLAVGGTAVYTLTGQVSAAATGTLDNTASVSLVTGAALDVEASNDVALDSDQLLTPTSTPTPTRTATPTATATATPPLPLLVEPLIEGQEQVQVIQGLPPGSIIDVVAQTAGDPQLGSAVTDAQGHATVDLRRPLASDESINAVNRSTGKIGPSVITLAVNAPTPTSTATPLPSQVQGGGGISGLTLAFCLLLAGAALLPRRRSDAVLASTTRRIGRQRSQNSGTGEPTGGA